jgi:electron transport complex protein RnfG
MSRRDKRPEDKKPAAATGAAETALVQGTAPAAADTAAPQTPSAPRRDRREKKDGGGLAALLTGPERPYVLRLTVTLFGISAAAALLLGIVYCITKPVIDWRTEEKTKAAMAMVLEAEEYPKVEGLTLPDGVTALHAATDGGVTVGYVCEVSSNGFGGAMSLVVGVDLDGRVTGVSVIKHSETKNIGTKVVMSSKVLSRFIGLESPVTLNGGINRFDGVTGATFSSKGVTAAVNAALTAVDAVLS